MVTSIDSPQVFQFGVFELDRRARELRKQGSRIRLQEQPFQVLVLLLERAGEVVTRKELHEKLWPSSVFVDFDHGLNNAIARLREALGDRRRNVGQIPDEAGPHFRRARQLDANNSGVLEMRLLLLIKSGRGKEALALSEQALVLDPLRWGIVWRRATAAMISERFDVAEAAIRGMDPGGAVWFWPAVIMARLARGERAEARAALRDLESAISAFERLVPATDSGATAARLMRGRFKELSEMLAALDEDDVDSRMALAARLFARASDPAAESGSEYAYLVELPAISVLEGVDRAFEAWNRRLDRLPPYDPDFPTNDHRDDVFSLQDNGYLPGFRLLHRDPRFWSLLARYDPRVFVVPTSPHGGPRPQEVVDRTWGDLLLWPPDFCRAQNFPYDCDAVAGAAFRGGRTGSANSGRD